MIQGYALSPQQRQLWRHDNQSSAQLILEISGELNKGQLKDALELVIKNHEIFRTKLIKPENIDFPIQVVSDAIDIFWEPDCDLTRLPNVEKKNSLYEKIKSTRLPVNDNQSNSLIRALLIHSDEKIHLLAINVKSYHVDSKSLDNLAFQIAEAYRAIASGIESFFAEDVIQYIDVSEWENEFLKSDASKTGKNYWLSTNFLESTHHKIFIEKQEIADAAPDYQLFQAFTIEKIKFSKTAAIVDELKTDYSNFFLALWQIMLYRLDKRESFILGLMQDGRADEEVESVIGILAKFLPLNTVLNDGLQLEQVLLNNTKLIARCQDLQECFSWDEFCASSEDNKLFIPYCFEWENQSPAFNVDGLLFSTYFKYACYDKFKLKLSCSLNSEQQKISIDFHYDNAGFSDEPIKRLAEQFNCLLDSILSDPHAAIGSLNIISQTELQTILYEFNNTDIDYYNDLNIFQLFESQVKMTPNSIAVEFDGKVITYKELNIKASKLARVLLQADVKVEEKIGVFLERSIDSIVAILAIFKSGGVYLPLDISYPQERIDYIISDSKTAIIITTSNVLEKIKVKHLNLLCLDRINWSEQSELDHNISISNNNNSYIIYTSGSTGLPKGTLVSHTALVSHCLSVKAYYSLVPDDRVLLFAPFSFDPSLEQSLPALITGAVVVVKNETVWNVTDVAENIRNMQLSVVNFPTAYWHLLVQHWDSTFEKNLGNLRLMIVGGDRMLSETVERWLHLGFANIRLLNAYGPTEATITATVADINDIDRDRYIDIPIGKPLPNRKVYLLDEYLAPVPLGYPGELYLSGQSLASGYFNRHELTKEKFVLNPFDNTQKSIMYKTGDRAFFSQSGDLYFLGRIDDQIKIRGYRVELGEIEQLLSQQIDIQEVAVIVKGLNDNEQDKQLIAFYVSTEKQDLKDRLRAYLQEKLPEYMLPAFYYKLDFFPLSPNGKVDRKALAKIIIENTECVEFREPSNLVESKIIEFLSHLIGLKNISVNENFLQLGGHSLMAMRLAANIRKEFAVELSLREIYESKDISVMAEIVENLQKNEKINIPALTVVPRDEALPLSYSQLRLWLLDEMGFGKQYHMPAAFKIHGNLDEKSLQKSIKYILSRHESLRTKFYKKNNGEVIQVIENDITVPIEKIKFFSEKKDTWIDTIKQWAEKPFHLSTAPLLRFILIQVDPFTQVLGVCMHHIISDAASISILLRELNQTYSDFFQEKNPNMGELKVQYPDYASWQRKNCNVSMLQKELNYWRSQLKGYENFGLLTDFPRPNHFTGKGGIVQFKIESKDVQRYKIFCKNKKVTLYSFLMSAVHYLLSQYSQQTDFCIGMPIAGRNHPDVENIIGCFVNTLVLKIKAGTYTGSVSQFIENIHNTITEAQEYQNLSFDLLVEQIVVERDLSRNPIFQVLLNYVKLENKLVLANHDLEDIDLGYAAAKCDLAFDFTENMDESVALTITYSKDLYLENTIKRMSAHLFEVINNMLIQSEESIYNIQFHTKAERDIIVKNWSSASAINSGKKYFHTLFEERSASAPYLPAIIFDEEQLTYDQLNKRSNQLAHYLIKLGVKADDLIGLCVERSLDMAIGLLGIAKAGGAYVPLDPAYPEQRLQHMLSDSKISFVLTHIEVSKKINFLNKKLILIDSEETQSLLSSYKTNNPEPSELGLGVNNLAYVIYTSGSTGLPKGVMIEHNALANFLLGTQKFLSLDNKTRWLAVTTIAFDIAGLEIFGPLISGGCVYLCNSEQSRDGQQLALLIDQFNINIMQATPASWRLLLDCGWQGNQYINILCGGEALPPLLASQLKPLCNRLINCYGPTEATIWSHMADIDSVQALHPIKGLLPGYRQYVTNIINENSIVPVGIPGELVLGGSSLARGYLNQPELTKEKFSHNEYIQEKNEYLYKTGDLVRWLDDGTLEFLGRIDQQVKIRGFRIELGEIEFLLAKSFGVRDAVVIALKDVYGESQLVAYVVLKENLSSINDEVAEIKKQAHIKSFSEILGHSLPKYMIPEKYVFLDALPYTPNGKINRKELPALGKIETHKEKYNAPCNETEVKLCHIWQQVLHVDLIGLDDNFFNLGGHSLTASRLIAIVRDELNVEISLRTLFENPTVRSFANIILTKHDEFLLSPIIPIDRTKNLFLSYAQQRMWFIDQYGKGSAQYNMPVAFKLEGNIDANILKVVFNNIIDRHEVFRTGFASEKSEVALFIRENFSLPFFASDLSSLQSTEQISALEKIVNSEITKPFNLSHDILIRMHLVKLSEVEHIVVLTMHHITSDARSLEILLNEFNQLYTACIKCEKNPLQKQAIQYIDYAHWQRELLSGELLTKHINYWKNYLQDIPLVHNLPLDKPRPSEQTYTGKTYLVDIGANLTKQIKLLCKEQEVTLFMFLQSAFSILLGRYSNEEDIVIGSPIAGRLHKNVENLIGFFANTIVLRSNLSGNPEFISLLQKNKQVVLNAFTHQHIPFEMLVDVLNPERSMRHGPIFQILLVLQNRVEGSLDFPNVSATQIELENTLTKFDIELSVVETEQGLSLSWHYNTSLFYDESIERMAKSFSALLSGIVNDPGKPISQLPLLTEEDKSVLINNNYHVVSNYSKNSCIHELFEEQAVKYPDKCALVCNDKKITYKELNERSNQLAHYLIERNVKPESLIGLCIDRSIEMLIGIIGILKAGAAYVPLDPTYPLNRLEYILKDCGTNIVITKQYLHKNIETLQNQHVIYLDDVSLAEKLRIYSSANPKVHIESNSLMYVIYTSGSTGQPKGVLVEHHNVARLFESANKHFAFTENDTWTLFHSYAFDFSVWEMWGALLYGGKLVIVPYDTARDSALFLSLLLKEDVTYLSQIPTAFYSLLRIMVGKTNEHKLKYIVFGGEALDYNQLKPWFTSFENSQTQLINMYGITETTVHVTYKEITKNDLENWTSCIGKPLDDLLIAVCDEYQQLVPLGVAGELLVGGPGVARGYLNNPNLTSEKFIVDPFFEDSTYKFYRTGDLIKQSSDGNLHYLGRIDNQEKVRGFRMELGEIEYHLSKVDGVEEAVVVARSDARKEKFLVGYLVQNESMRSQENDREQKNNRIATIITILKKSLPEYMVPNVYVFLESMPLTPSGKVNRKTLPVVTEEHLQKQEYVAPVNEIQLKLCRIWENHLQLEQVGIHDNYFSLGGDSIRALGIVALAENEGIHFFVADIFKYPTVNELSAYVKQSSDDESLQIDALARLLEEIENLSEEDTKLKLGIFE